MIEDSKSSKVKFLKNYHVIKADHQNKRSSAPKCQLHPQHKYSLRENINKSNTSKPKEGKTTSQTKDRVLAPSKKSLPATKNPTAKYSGKENKKDSVTVNDIEICGVE